MVDLSLSYLDPVDVADMNVGETYLVHNRAGIFMSSNLWVKFEVLDWKMDSGYSGKFSELTGDHLTNGRSVASISGLKNNVYANLDVLSEILFVYSLHKIPDTLLVKLLSECEYDSEGDFDKVIDANSIGLISNNLYEDICVNVLSKSKPLLGVNEFKPKIVASSRVAGLEGVEVDRDVWVVVHDGFVDIVREGYVRDSGWAGVLRLEVVLWAGQSLFFGGDRDKIIGEVTYREPEVGVKLVEALKLLEKNMEGTE